MSFAAHADAWLAEVMNRPVFRVDGSGETTELAAHIAANGRASSSGASSGGASTSGRGSSGASSGDSGGGSWGDSGGGSSGGSGGGSSGDSGGGSSGGSGGGSSGSASGTGSSGALEGGSSGGGSSSSGSSGAFYFAKVGTDRVADVAALAKLGFVVVDTNVTFELMREPSAASPSIEVSEVAEGDADAVLDIAGSAFRYSRFHLDPLISDELAHHIKREWIRNYVLRKRGDALLVAHLDDRVVGFLAAIVAHGTAIIDLVAVASDANGLGVGSALTLAFAQKYRGMSRIVGTQVANVPSVRLYTKLGFSLVRSQYVLHHHANR